MIASVLSEVLNSILVRYHSGPGEARVLESAIAAYVDASIILTIGKPPETRSSEIDTKVNL